MKCFSDCMQRKPLLSWLIYLTMELLLVIWNGKWLCTTKGGGIIVVVWIVERSFMLSLFVHTRFVLLNNHSLSRLLSWTKPSLQSMVNHTLQVIMYFEHHHHYHISDSVCFPAWCLFPSLGFSVKSTKLQSKNIYGEAPYAW